jgi:hypothetical protein
MDSGITAMSTTGKLYANGNRSYVYKVSIQDNSLYGGGYRAGTYGRIYMSKKGSRSLTVPNDTMIYTLYYDNDGEAVSADTFTIIDYLPNRARYVDTLSSSLHTGGNGRIDKHWYLNGGWTASAPATPADKDSVRAIRWDIWPGVGAQDSSNDAAGADKYKTGMDTTPGMDSGWVRFKVRIL